MSRGRRFVESGATGEFELDGARREAADRVVVLKVLDTLGLREATTRGSAGGDGLDRGAIRGDKRGQRRPTPVSELGPKPRKINAAHRRPTLGCGLISVTSVVQLYPGP